MNFEIRFGTPDDTREIVDFILDAGGGIFEQILDGVVPLIPLRDLIALAVAEDDSPFNFRNCLMAEADGSSVGMALCYPSSQYGLPAMAQGVVPDHRLEPVRAILNSRLDRSFYLNTLVVSREASGQGLARLLLEMAAELGRLAGFDTISLHAWTDNETAFRLYENVGFRTLELIEAGPSKYLRYRGPMALMAMSIPELLAARSAASASG
jgi:ribosomal protein S18 acetylase RimI-like enzyme